ncbi:MAG: folylpolyglutamate synthase/dihydrofolate synthase family protein [Candidatus Neomarinimicrobiota bacterium]
MNVQPELGYLYSLTDRGIKPGLERIQKLLAGLDNPQNSYKTIHVAGTNGKGSTSVIIAGILRAAGFRVGLYTSPHLIRFNERIRVDSQLIGDDYIVRFLQLWRVLIDRFDCSFFEATTALAMDFFRSAKVDYAIMETGMGGRFDATNVGRPEVSVITPIGRDHQEFLGTRLAQIAFEKAGIAKEGVPCVLAKQTPRIHTFLTKEVRLRGASPFYAPELCRTSITGQFPDHQELNLTVGDLVVAAVRFPLIGAHQLVNLQAAVTAVSLLKPVCFNREILTGGIGAVVWPGRLQILRQKPLIYYDVGHNQHGIRQAVRTLVKLFPGQSIHVMLALGSQKKFERIGEILRPLNGEVFLTEIPGHPSLAAERLGHNIRQTISPSRLHIEKNPQRFLTDLTARLEPDEILLIIGSHYLGPSVLPFFSGNHLT